MRLDLEILNEIFEENSNSGTIHYEGKCHNCGDETIVSITKTQSGYGFLGGILYKAESNQLMIECVHCQTKAKRCA